MTEPPASVLSAFGLTGTMTALAGGQEPTFLIGGVVLKRTDPGNELFWKADLLSRVEEDGFRLARPVRTVDGSWSFGGWMAARYVSGASRPIPWPDMVRASRRFHEALSAESRPALLDGQTHRWARAHRVAWEEVGSDCRPEFGSRLRRLWPLVGPLPGRRQLIHGDLAGNVLFAPGLAPAVIDFSPWWAPVSYAEGIMACDGLLWYGADQSLIELLGGLDEIRSSVARGAIFRLVSLNEGITEGHPEFGAELARFDWLIEMLESPGRA